MTTDTVSDALIRIKNSYLSYKRDAVLPYSKLVVAICQLLQAEGYIDGFAEESNEKNPNIKQIKVSLKYEGKKPSLTAVKRISKPGLRVYKGKKTLPYVLNGLGIAIISTPKGVMSDKKARKEGLGGEVMAYVW